MSNENIKSALGQLKYPLVFFGLALLVTESAFATGLWKNVESEKLTIILSSWMGGLFLVSIIVVAFLVYKVPTHIMLESQKDLQQDLSRLQNLRSRVNVVTAILTELSHNPPSDPTTIVEVFGRLRGVLVLDEEVV